MRDGRGGGASVRHCYCDVGIFVSLCAAEKLRIGYHSHRQPYALLKPTADL
jgi:hypothetical protein